MTKGKTVECGIQCCLEDEAGMKNLLLPYPILNPQLLQFVISPLNWFRRYTPRVSRGQSCKGMACAKWDGVCAAIGLFRGQTSKMPYTSEGRVDYTGEWGMMWQYIATIIYDQDDSVFLLGSKHPCRIWWRWRCGHSMHWRRNEVIEDMNMWIRPNSHTSHWGTVEEGSLNLLICMVLVLVVHNWKLRRCWNDMQDPKYCRTYLRGLKVQCQTPILPSIRKLLLDLQGQIVLNEYYTADGYHDTPGCTFAHQLWLRCGPRAVIS